MRHTRRVDTAKGLMAVVFPFSAIVGQDEMKLAILIAAVDAGGRRRAGVRRPRHRQVHRGARAGRAAAADEGRGRLPLRLRPRGPAGLRRLRAAEGPAANAKTQRVPVPVVDLPLGATEDRVVGALDLERALTQGVKAFEPGLLARAHRGFLYIDEVNLLEDHLVDLLIDVAASGENVVEREGLSVRHPARFVLVGSGNPEEGELRPQLLDRFGLAVEVRTPGDVADARAGGAPARRLRARPRRLHCRALEGRGRQAAPPHAGSSQAPADGRGARRRARAARRRCAWRSAPTACAAS
jgi:magnesium chelatase subunit I